MLQKCSSVASHPDIAVVCLYKWIQNIHRLSYKQIWAHVPSGTWVMLIKSKYNKHYDKDEFCIYKAKRKVISQRLLNTSEVCAKTQMKPHMLKSLARRHRQVNWWIVCFRAEVEIWLTLFTPDLGVGSGSPRGAKSGTESLPSTHTNTHTHLYWIKLHMWKYRISQ